MSPELFELVNVSAVQTLLGTPVRFYEFGEAPPGVILPYAVWQTTSGEPENFLGDAPDVDMYRIQFDVYGKSATTVRSAAEALRDVLQPAGHVVSYNGEFRDTETKNYRYSFSVEFFIDR